MHSEGIGTVWSEPLLFTYAFLVKTDLLDYFPTQFPIKLGKNSTGDCSNISVRNYRQFSSMGA